jgi:amidase
MTPSEEYTDLDAMALTELILRKKVTPRELVEAAIERIEELNPTLNAVVTPMYEQALSAANSPSVEGPFAGVPFLLKDVLAAYAGVKMTLGSNLLRDFVPDHDSELVARLKRAGLIIVGKTNTPELGLLPTTEPHLFGACRNPWNSDRTTGGSSGGSAAAVSAGMVPMAHANDGGGSIRIPAACCGLFGLKPTRARNPLGPDFGDLMSGLLVEHAVTRSVRDSAALLDATSGPDRGDPYWAPPPTRPFIMEVGADPGRIRGHEVVEAAPKLNGELITHAFTVIWSSECTATLKLLNANRDQVEPLTWALAEMGGQYSAADYLQALTTLQRISRLVADFLVDYDVWLTPTLAEPPVPLGTFDSPPDDPLRGFRRAMEFVPFTPICNITGQPAMSVPLFWNAEDLPIGTHFIGRFGDEATLFRLASQLEQARPWADRRPPVSA